MAAFLLYPCTLLPSLSPTAKLSPLLRRHPLKLPHPLPLLASALHPDSPHQSGSPSSPDEQLRAGSPIVVVEAPPLLKTAEPMPMMRPNTGLIKPGDAGRIINRRPKDVWAVRFAVGAYLIDRKYFKPLETL